MELDQYQQQARNTMRRSLSPRDGLLDAAAGLAEEAGEVLSHVRKHLFFDEPLDRDAVREELGDALWCLAAIATRLDLSLGDVATANLQKVAKRVRKDPESRSADQRGESTDERGDNL